jgi:hypothetical protein
MSHQSISNTGHRRDVNKLLQLSKQPAAAKHGEQSTLGAFQDSPRYYAH